jgi:hypothetical protein
MKILKNANKSFRGAGSRLSPFACSRAGVLCSLLLVSIGGASAQAQERPDTTLDRTRPVSKVTDKNRAREFDVLTAQPPNSILVRVQYKKEYGYKSDSGVFAGSGPSSCDAFSISAQPDPSVRPGNLYGVHKTDKMRELSGFYVCDFLATDLPLNARIKVGVDLTDHRNLPFEAWKGGSQAQPPPGEQRTIIMVGARTSRERRAHDDTVMLTEAQPSATRVFEMVYAPSPFKPPTQPVPQPKRLPVTPR